LVEYDIVEYNRKQKEMVVCLRVEVLGVNEGWRLSTLRLKGLEFEF
jgi:hypothetical protein